MNSKNSNHYLFMGYIRKCSILRAGLEQKLNPQLFWTPQRLTAQGDPRLMMMKKLLQPLQSVSGPLWVHGEKTQLSSPCKYYSTLRSLHSAATQVGKEAPVVSGPQQFHTSACTTASAVQTSLFTVLECFCKYKHWGNSLAHKVGK